MRGVRRSASGARGAAVKAMPRSCLALFLLRSFIVCTLNSQPQRFQCCYDVVHSVMYGSHIGTLFGEKASE